MEQLHWEGDYLEVSRGAGDEAAGVGAAGDEAAGDGAAGDEAGAGRGRLALGRPLPLREFTSMPQYWDWPFLE